MNRRLPAIQSYWLMLIATIITIAIVTASQLITQRIGLLLDRQASELLAADLVVASSAPLAQSYREKAGAEGLNVATTISMRTAIFIDDEPQLVELKAAGAGYPLRGQLETARDLNAEKQRPKQGPSNGEVWIDTRLSAQLGQSILLGKQSFEANWLLTFEPDRGGSLFNLAPRVLMNLDDLHDTGLIIPGSRVRCRVLFSGSGDQINRFRRWLKPRLQADESIQDIETARPEMRRALERTRSFFALSIILTLVIAMVAIAITASYTAGREAPKVAILRAFGIAQTRLVGFYLREIGKLWIIASLVGIAFGWLSQFPLQWALDGWFGRELPQVDTMQPFLVAALVGLVSLAGFCLPYLLSVIATPPMQVFRPVTSRRSLKRNVLFGVSAIVTVFLVLILLMQSSLLAVVTLGVILVATLMLPVIFGLLIRALLFSGNHRFWLKRYLLSRLRSSTRAAIVVMSGFSLALLAILMIAIVKDELLAAWDTQLPDDIPNYFLINLAREDVPQIRQSLEQQAIASSDPYPLVRTRLAAINGVPVAQIAFADPRASNLVNHTFNVSFSEVLPDDNAIIEGQWIAGENPTNQFSVEQGMAERLAIKIGDVIALSVGAETIEAPVSSIRTVLWENFKPNFYLIANRRLIEHKPQTWLLSARIEDNNKPALKQLLQQFPAITLLDVSILMARIQAIIDRATIALEFFFLFALASAFIVLLAAIQTGKAERQKESALLRALSAQNRQLYSVHVLEFTLMGLLVGFFAALFASLAGWLISVQFFDIDYHFSPTTWIYGLVSATLVLTIAGTMVSRKVYNISPMKILRS
ncbi:MAG: hypothetical protein GY763_12975 [Gammaproteobacteria bacterium]|nr:hypothetical protein [Gammaproteobacteria bacterium]